MEKQIITADKEAIFSDSEFYFRKICGFPMEGEKEIEEAREIRQSYEDQLLPSICLTICQENGEKELRASYAMGIPEIDREGLDMLEAFYLDTWMIAMLDSARDWLREYLHSYITEKMGTERYVSSAFGPGFFDMGMEEVPKILEKAGGEKIGVTWNGKSLNPPKSNVGYFLISEEKQKILVRDCKNCLSDRKNCVFCKGFSPKPERM